MNTEYNLGLTGQLVKSQYEDVLQSDLARLDTRALPRRCQFGPLQFGSRTILDASQYGAGNDSGPRYSRPGDAQASATERSDSRLARSLVYRCVLHCTSPESCLATLCGPVSCPHRRVKAANSCVTFRRSRRSMY